MNPPESDWLTGLARKDLLQERFLQLVKQGTYRFAIVFIDIDGLRYYNDQYGHLQGDEVLKQMAEIISQQIPPDEKAFRVGGDKFVILLNKSNSTAAICIAEEIRKLAENKFSQIVVKRYHISETFDSSLTVSCGIAFYPDNGDNLNTMLAAVDNAIYEKAKLLGGNKVVLVNIMPS